MEKCLFFLGWLVIIAGVATTIFAGSLSMLSYLAISVGLFSSIVLGVLIIAFGELLKNINAIRHYLESTRCDE